MTDSAVDIKVLAAEFDNPAWRINNLYLVKPREGGEGVVFKTNPIQEKFYWAMKNRNVILKPRGIGFTTLLCLFELDLAMHNPGINVGITAHTEEKAKDIFRDHIRYGYDNYRIPEVRIPLAAGTQGSQTELVFANGSVIRVDVGLRSGTYQVIHSSELGPMSKTAPEKAEEFVSGTLPTVRTASTYVFIESTAAGTTGVFYEMVQRAQKANAEIAAKVRPENDLDYRFHFFGWWEDDTKVLDAEVIIPKYLDEYFDALAVKHGVKLTREQKAWYVVTADEQGEFMRSNYPSVAEEAFEASMEGAYFSKAMNEAAKTGRIGRYAYDPRYMVDTWWDIGINDEMSIWFSQTTGNMVNMIDFYENSGEGLLHYIDVMKAKPWGRRYGRHVGPHDINTRDAFTARTKRQTAAQHGITFEYVERPRSIADAVESARMILPRCCFDKANCALGIEHMECYRKEWDRRHGVWKDRPLHDRHSHGASAFMVFAQFHDRLIQRGQRRPLTVKYETF